MNTAEIEAQAYNISVAQGKVILQMLTHMEKIMVAKSGVGPVEATALLDLARAMSNVGGHPA